MNANSDSRPIVVGIDGSAQSERGFEVALLLASNQQRPVHLISAYAVEAGGYKLHPGTGLQFAKSAEQTATETLAALVRRAEEAGVMATSRTVWQDAAGVLIDASEAADLLVVGKRGRNRFAGTFLGSVSLNVAARSACPTLVVPEKWHPLEGDVWAPAQERPDFAEEEPTELVAEASGDRTEPAAFDNVAEGLNFRREIVAGIDVNATNTVALQAAEYANLLGRPLTLVSAGHYGADVESTAEFEQERQQVQSAYSGRLTELAAEVTAKYPDLAVHWKLFGSSAAGVLAEATRSASMVVVGTRGRGGFTGLLLGSASQTVLTRAVCPVLVVPTRVR